MTKSSCVEGSADTCDRAGKKLEAYTCMCGTSGQCSGTTPKCDDKVSPSTCVACDETFCKQPLPRCIPAGMADAGSCRCGSLDTCGTGNQLGNLCTSDDETGQCMCGEKPLCTKSSTVASCLNNVVPPVFEAGDKSSTCKCSADSCLTATDGKVLSNGACSNVAGNCGMIKNIVLEKSIIHSFLTQNLKSGSIVY